MFYLGTHCPEWLGRTPIPLFLSYQRLRRRKVLGHGRWAVDSGGFTELQSHGRWTIPPEEYVERLIRLSELAGPPDFAACQDWMCEPHLLKLTGLTVLEHQRRTIDSYLELLRLAPNLPWTPVIQGWVERDYLRHVEMYRASGVELSSLSMVGLGSVCRRQATKEAASIITVVSEKGIDLHAFGVKTQGLQAIAHRLKSADSMAWSFVARRERIQLPGHSHKNCANCLPYATLWHDKLLKSI